MKTIKLVRKSAPKEWKGDGYKLLLYGESDKEIGAIMPNARKESPNLTLVDDNGFKLENDNGNGFECKLYTSEQDSSYQGTVFFDSTGKCTGGKFDNKNSGGSVPGFKQTQRPVVREPLIKQSPKEPQSESQQPAATAEQPTTQDENRPIFNLGNSGSSASSNNAEKTPSEITFTIDLQDYYDAMETAITWSRDDGYDLFIDGSNSFTTNQLIASVKNKKLRIRKINPNAAKNENPETEKFDGGIGCKIILDAGWGYVDVGPLKFNENGEVVSLDGEVRRFISKSYLAKVNKDEIVAFFARPEWVLAKGNGEVVGKILRGGTVFKAPWPAPRKVYNELVAKKFNGDAVKGEIKFYTDTGRYAGAVEFSENGSGKATYTTNADYVDIYELRRIKFVDCFLTESLQCRLSELHSLSDINEICEKVVSRPDFRTRLKDCLDPHENVLNNEGERELRVRSKVISIPDGYEEAAACLLYMCFFDLGVNDDTTPEDSEKSEKSKEKTENTASDSNSSNSNASNTVSFGRAYDNAWRAFDNGGNRYIIRIKGGDRDVAASDYVIYKMIQDKLIKVYKINNQGALINPGADSHKFEFVEKGKAKCGLTIEINDEGEVTKSTCKFDNDNEGYKAFYDKAKVVLGEEEFKKQIIGSSGSMGSIASVDKISKILEKKGLKPEQREYGKFAEAIEEYIKEGKNGIQEEKPAQPDAETKSSPSGASAQSSNQGEIIFKELNNGTFWYSDDGTKQIAVNCDYLRTKKFGWDINYALLYRMVKDEIVKLYDKDGKTISATCRIKSNDDKDFGTITFNNGDVSSHTLEPPTDDEGDKGKLYDCIRELLRVSDFKKQLVYYDGNLIHMVRGIGIISDIIQKAGKNINSYDHGEFVSAIEEYIKDKETLEDAKNEALKDLYTRLGQQLPNGMTIEKFEPENFVKLLGLKPKVRTKVENKLEALGKLKDSKEKQIDLLTRLLMRMKRKKDFEKNHKFGKIRYALGEREKTDPKIKKCFEAAGKYIVKNYDKFGQIVNEGDVKKECSNLKNIFVDLHVGEPWADNLDGKLKIEIVRKCWTSSNYQGPFKAMMGIIFASMAGIEKSEDLICACDALKKGGIKSSKKDSFLWQASQIRKSIKALCGRDNVKPAARKVVIKKLLVNDYQFIRNASSCNDLFPPEPEQSK